MRLRDLGKPASRSCAFEKAADGLANDLAGRRALMSRAGFHSPLQLRVESDRYDFRGS